MATTNTFYVLYNDCFGGFCISHEAEVEYNRRATLLSEQCDLYNLTTHRREYHNDYTDERFDPILIEMFLDKEWNTDYTRINHKHSNIKIARFDIKYRDFIIIDEYDGKEMPHVDMGPYLKTTTRQILYDNTMDDATKILKLQELIPPLTSIHTKVEFPHPLSPPPSYK